RRLAVLKRITGRRPAQIAPVCQSWFPMRLMPQVLHYQIPSICCMDSEAFDLGKATMEYDGVDIVIYDKETLA
ncbi:MAG: hypothetical protein LUC32_01045, partial [Clostridiales bacterium]|nr:hypothetical protein [Clostridiales bacterium]